MYAQTGHKGCDTSDMNVCGFFQAADGSIYNEVAWNYMDFKYYMPEKPVGKRRIIKKHCGLPVYKNPYSSFSREILRQLRIIKLFPPNVKAVVYILLPSFVFF